MKNSEILFLVENLGLVDAPDMEPEFNYAISATLTDAENIADNIRKGIEEKQGMKDYSKTIQELRIKHANKDPEGEAKFIIQDMGNGMKQKVYEIPGLNDMQSPFQKEVSKLKEKNKTVLEEREKQLEFLDKENKDFKPHMVTMDLLPRGLSRRAMDAVFLITEKPKK